MCNQIQLRERASYSYCARSWRQQTNPSRKKNFPSGWKCYKTIGSCVSRAFVEIWSTREVWVALTKLELLSATPRVTLTHLSCSPNFSFVSRWTHADVWTNTAIMCVGRMQYALTLEYSSLVPNMFFKTLFCFCFVVWFNILLQYCIWPRISIYFGLGLEYLCHFYLRLYSILSTCSVFLDIDVRKTVISLHKCCNFFFFEVGRHVIYHLYFLMYSVNNVDVFLYFSTSMRTKLWFLFINCCKFFFFRAGRFVLFICIFSCIQLYSVKIVCFRFSYE